MAGELERVRKALRELSKALRSLPGDPAPKDVHKLRTASRRLESLAEVLATIEPKKSRRLVKSIEPLRRAAGGVRDMDVLIANAHRLARYGASASLKHLVAHLEIARQQQAAELQRVLQHRRKAAREALKAYCGSVQWALKKAKLPRAKSTSRAGAEASQVQENIRAAAMSVLRELGDWKPLDAGNLHQFRLKVKHLRYTLQLDADANAGLVEALGHVQRTIGGWHDWQQLNAIAREVLLLEQDRALLDRIAGTAKRRLDNALAAANALRGRYLNAPLAMGV